MHRGNGVYKNPWIIDQTLQQECGIGIDQILTTLKTLIIENQLVIYPDEETTQDIIEQVTFGRIKLQADYHFYGRTYMTDINEIFIEISEMENFDPEVAYDAIIYKFKLLLTGSATDEYGVP